MKTLGNMRALTLVACLPMDAKMAMRTAACHRANAHPSSSSRRPVWAFSPPPPCPTPTKLR